jgi:hypothetical protein
MNKFNHCLLATAAGFVMFAGLASAASAKHRIDVPSLLYEAMQTEGIHVYGDGTSRSEHSAHLGFTAKGFTTHGRAGTDFDYQYSRKGGLVITITTRAKNDDPPVVLEVADVNGDGAVDRGTDYVAREFYGRNARNDGKVEGAQYRAFFQSQFEFALDQLQWKVAAKGKIVRQ